MEETDTYYGSKSTVYHSYSEMTICGYLNVICCAIGSIQNFFVIIVFTRKNMVSPVNTILVYLAITETLTMITYMPHTWQEFFRVTRYPAIKEHRTHNWELISLTSYHLAFIFRHTTIWLTLMLGIWRYVAVMHPLKERKWCKMKNTRVCVIAGYVFGVVTWMPLWFMLQITQVVKLVDQNGLHTSNHTKGVKNETIFEIHAPLVKNLLVYRIIFILYGIFLKVLPSIILAVISIRLINALLKAKNHRDSLTSNSYYDQGRTAKMKHQTYRTTVMLLIILLLLILGEVPHGIYCLLTGCLGPKFYNQHYYYATEICNTLVKFTECANFAVYYLMSRKFRNTLKSLFRQDESYSRTLSPRKTSTIRILNSALETKASKSTDSTTKTADFYEAQ